MLLNYKGLKSTTEMHKNNHDMLHTEALRSGLDSELINKETNNPSRTDDTNPGRNIGHLKVSTTLPAFSPITF